VADWNVFGFKGSGVVDYGPPGIRTIRNIL